MSQKQQVTQPSDFIIDPSRDGVTNALWKAYTGALALAATTPDRFRFNADDAVVRADLLFGIVEFAVRFPLTGVQAVTNLVNDIAFGLKNQSMGNLAKIDLFADKSENTLTFRTYDDCGTVQSTVIPWDTDWNGALTIFRFGWSDAHVSLDVLQAAGTAFTNLANHTTRVPLRALNPFVTVVGAENLDVDFIAIKNVQHSSIMLI